MVSDNWLKRKGADLRPKGNNIKLILPLNAKKVPVIFCFSLPVFSLLACCASEIATAEGSIHLHQSEIEYESILHDECSKFFRCHGCQYTAVNMIDSSSPMSSSGLSTPHDHWH